MRSYVDIHTLTLEPCFLTTESQANATKTWLCVGCGAPKPDASIIDVAVQEPSIEGPINFISGCSLTIVKRTFLHKFSADLVHRDLDIGRVFGPRGDELLEWATLRGKTRLIVRGTDHVACRRCPLCGRDVYFALGRKYLYPEPRGSATIFERSGGGGIIIPE